MGLTGNEVSAANEQRRNEDLDRSKVGDVLSSGASTACATTALGASLDVCGQAGLALVVSVVAGMGIVDWFRRLGTGKVEENLEALGQATEDAFNRVERVLVEQGESIEEIQRRFESDDLKQAMAGASLQALRTSNEKRLRRLALILANGLKDNDLKEESLDDMMRAAVELKAFDVLLLQDMHEMDKTAKSETGNDRTNVTLFEIWQKYWDRFPVNYPAVSCHSVVGAFGRLTSLGFIFGAESTSMVTSPVAMNYWITEEGTKFYERLQAIGS